MPFPNRCTAPKRMLPSIQVRNNWRARKRLSPAAFHPGFQLCQGVVFEWRAVHGSNLITIRSTHDFFTRYWRFAPILQKNVIVGRSRGFMVPLLTQFLACTASCSRHWTAYFTRRPGLLWNLSTNPTTVGADSDGFLLGFEDTVRIVKNGALTIGQPGLFRLASRICGHLPPTSPTLPHHFLNGIGSGPRLSGLYRASSQVPARC